LLAYALHPHAWALARNRREGRIHNLEIKASRREADAPIVFTARGRFVDLQVRPVAKFPGVDKFSGNFAASEAAGKSAWM